MPPSDFYSFLSDKEYWTVKHQVQTKFREVETKIYNRIFTQAVQWYRKMIGDLPRKSIFIDIWISELKIMPEQFKKNFTKMLNQNSFQNLG